LNPSTPCVWVDHISGALRDADADPGSDENGIAPAGAMIALLSPQPEKEMVLDHGCPSSDPWAAYAEGSFERDIRSSRAEPVTDLP